MQRRSAATFANINLLGKCTLDCNFCLGKDLEKEFSKYDFNKVHFDAWSRFEEFLGWCRNGLVKQLYITGQNTDPTCYKYIHELVDYLKEQGFYVGVRSNGMIPDLALFNACTTCTEDAVGLTMLTRDPDRFFFLTGRRSMPEWEKLIPKITVPLRMAIVVTQNNAPEVLDLIQYISQFRNVRYVQLRRVSTITRRRDWKPAQDEFEKLAKEIDASFTKLDEYETAPIYSIYGMRVSLWRTILTTANSWNYFVNGVLSSEYEIIRGYMKQKGMKIPDEPEIS